MKWMWLLSLLMLGSGLQAQTGIKEQFPAPVDTFAITRSACSPEISYHGLRVRQSLDLVPLLRRVDDELVQRDFRRSLLWAVAESPFQIIGTGMVGIGLGLSLSGRPVPSELWYGGVGCLLIGMGLDFLERRSLLQALHRYNFLVRSEQLSLRWQASPGGLGLTLAF